MPTLYSYHVRIAENARHIASINEEKVSAYIVLVSNNDKRRSDEQKKIETANAELSEAQSKFQTCQKSKTEYTNSIELLTTELSTIEEQIKQKTEDINQYRSEGNTDAYSRAGQERGELYVTRKEKQKEKNILQQEFVLCKKEVATCSANITKCNRQIERCNLITKECRRNIEKFTGRLVEHQKVATTHREQEEDSQSKADSLLANDDKFKSKTPNKTIYEIDEIGGTLSNKTITEFKEDAINVKADEVQVNDITITDQSSSTAHRDGIQLIPPGDQMAGGIIKDVRIMDNNMTSNGALQCIFASDGLFQNITITGNSLKTEGKHWISLNGLLSGYIENNTLTEGDKLSKKGEIKPSPAVRLFSARIGGNPMTCNLWILSFKKEGNKEHLKYGGILGSETSQVIDERGSLPSEMGGIGLENFAYWAFRDEVENSTLKNLLDRDSNLDGEIQSWFDLVMNHPYAEPRTLEGIVEYKDYYNTEYKNKGYDIPLNKIPTLFRAFLIQKIAVRNTGRISGPKCPLINP